jgi:hypothetical protein
MQIEIHPSEVTYERRYWRFRTQVKGQEVAKQIYNFVGTLDELAKDVRDNFIAPEDGTELIVHIVDSAEA